MSDDERTLAQYLGLNAEEEEADKRHGNADYYVDTRLFTEKAVKNWD